MIDSVVSMLRINRYYRPDYAEPYAGGCGLALGLLYGGFVNHVHLNDIDPGIWSFWHSVLEECDELIELIENTPVTVSEWRKQKQIVAESNTEQPVSLGFATFFLNRTNRSGIIKGAGVIGGIEQTGKYSIDCRYNRDDLVRRIKRVRKYKSRIHLYNHDALDFLKRNSCFEKNTFFAIDPPYYKKGPLLYTSFYYPEDHATVADTIRHLDYPWIVTYDNVAEVRGLYHGFRHFEFSVNYSLHSKRSATEILIASKGLKVPKEIRDQPAKQYSKSVA